MLFGDMVRSAQAKKKGAGGLALGSDSVQSPFPEAQATEPPSAGKTGSTAPQTGPAPELPPAEFAEGEALRSYEGPSIVDSIMSAAQPVEPAEAPAPVGMEGAEPAAPAPVATMELDPGTSGIDTTVQDPYGDDGFYLGRDAEGYDTEGYDEIGWNREGYDANGLDRNRRNREGLRAALRDDGTIMWHRANGSVADGPVEPDGTPNKIVYVIEDPEELAQAQREVGKTPQGADPVDEGANDMGDMGEPVDPYNQYDDTESSDITYDPKDYHEGGVVQNYAEGGTVPTKTPTWSYDLFKGSQREGVDTARAQQELYIQQLRQMAAGTGPSAARAQLMLAMEQNSNSMSAQARSARGTNPALALTNAMQIGSRANQASAGQAALLRAQEQLAASGQLGTALGQQRQQDLQAELMSLQAAQNDRDFIAKLAMGGLSAGSAALGQGGMGGGGGGGNRKEDGPTTEPKLGSEGLALGTKKDAPDNKFTDDIKYSDERQGSPGVTQSSGDVGNSSVSLSEGAPAPQAAPSAYDATGTEPVAYAPVEPVAGELAPTAAPLEAMAEPVQPLMDTSLSPVAEMDGPSIGTMPDYGFMDAVESAPETYASVDPYTEFGGEEAPPAEESEEPTDEEPVYEEPTDEERVDEAKGGVVPGTPQHPGQNVPENDTVDAKLTPKEVVLPLTVTQSSDPAQAAYDFMKDIEENEDPSDYGSVLEARRMASGGEVPPEYQQAYETSAAKTGVDGVKQASTKALQYLDSLRKKYGVQVKGMAEGGEVKKTEKELAEIERQRGAERMKKEMLEASHRAGDYHTYRPVSEYAARMRAEVEPFYPDGVGHYKVKGDNVTRTMRAAGFADGGEVTESRFSPDTSEYNSYDENAGSVALATPTLRPQEPTDALVPYLADKLAGSPGMDKFAQSNPRLGTLGHAALRGFGARPESMEKFGETEGGRRGQQGLSDLYSNDLLSNSTIPFTNTSVKDAKSAALMSLVQAAAPAVLGEVAGRSGAKLGSGRAAPTGGPRAKSTTAMLDNPNFKEVMTKDGPMPTPRNETSVPMEQRQQEFYDADPAIQDYFNNKRYDEPTQVATHYPETAAKVWESASQMDKTYTGGPWGEANKRQMKAQAPQGPRGGDDMAQQGFEEISSQDVIGDAAPSREVYAAPTEMRAAQTAINKGPQHYNPTISPEGRQQLVERAIQQERKHAGVNDMDPELRSLFGEEEELFSEYGRP